MPHSSFLQICNFLIVWYFLFFDIAHSFLRKIKAEYLLSTNGIWKVTCILVPVCVHGQQRHEEVICPDFLMTTMLSSSKILMIRQIVTRLPGSLRYTWTTELVSRGLETYCLQTITITKSSAESLRGYQFIQAEILLPHLANNRDFPELVQKAR